VSCRDPARPTCIERKPATEPWSGTCAGEGGLAFGSGPNTVPANFGRSIARRSRARLCPRRRPKPIRWPGGSTATAQARPGQPVKLLAGPNDADGFHTWTQEELDRFEAYWPLGTRERLAFDLLLYTGLRRGDAVRVGRQHERDGVITVRTEKHAKGKAGEQVSIPILPPLAASIAATRVGDMTYLVTETGGPWVKESFGNWFADACRKAGCPGSAHGLRKSGATRAAERGASERQLMAIFGWSTAKMAAHYTRSADRKRLAHDAAQLLLPAQEQNEKRPHLEPGAGASANVRSKSGA
jgi:integrase